MKKLLTGLASLLLICACAHNESVERSYTLLPVPQEIQTSDGDFTITNGTMLYINAPAGDKDAITNAFAAWDGMLEATDNNATSNCIAMEVCDNVEGVTSPEGYAIAVTKEKISVKATSAAGLFYAAQTLQQLADGLLGVKNPGIILSMHTQLARSDGDGIGSAHLRQLLPPAAV